MQVWISYAKFELSIEGPDRLQKCRQIYEEANKGMRSCEEKEERLMLLESWRDFEIEFGSDSTRERVRKLLPEKVKKRRKLTAEDGVRTGQQPANWSITSLLLCNFPSVYHCTIIVVVWRSLSSSDPFLRLWQLF